MNSKTKLIAIVIAFVLAIGATFGITYGVMAAQQTRVSGSITVTYTATEVAAQVSGKYQVLNGSATDFVTGTTDDNSTQDIDESKVIVFTGDETGSPASASFTAVSDIELTSTNKSVTFTYTIVNTSTSKAISAQVTLPTTMTNITVSAGTASDGTNSVTVTPGSNHTTDTFTVATGATVTYSVTASITEVKNGASYSGSFIWNLQLA